MILELIFTRYLKDRNEHSIFIQPTNPLELIRIINNLNANKASGPYSIDYEILHLIKLIIAAPLSRIINLSFEKAKYFENLKISKAIHVYKDKVAILIGITIGQYPFSLT